MSSKPEPPTEQCGSISHLKAMPASPGRRPLSRLQESGSGSPIRAGNGAVDVGSGRTCTQDHQNNTTSSTKSSSSSAASAAAPASESWSTIGPVPLDPHAVASEPNNADGNATEYAQNDRLPPPPPPPALPPEVPLSPVQQRQLSSRNLLTGGGNNNNADMEQQMGGGSSSSSADRDDVEKARGTDNDYDMVGENANANKEDASFTYESDCAVAATPQQQQYKRPPSGTPALFSALDKENGTADAAAATATASSVLSPMRSAAGATDTMGSTGMASTTSYDFHAAADGTATVADRSVATYGTSSTANSRTQLLPASRCDAGAGAGWPSSAPSTPISGRSHPATTTTASSAAATATTASVSAAFGFGGKKLKQKNTTPTRGGSSGLMLSPARTAALGSGGSSGMLSRIGAKLGRKRPSSTSSSSFVGTPGAGDGASTHFSPSTPIQAGAGMTSASADAAPPGPSADEFTLNRRNSGLPDVNSFPLGADGKKRSCSGTGGSSGGLLRFKAKGKIPSRKLNLPSTSLPSLSVAGMSGSAYEEAGLLDNDGKPTDTSLDMEDAAHMAALHATHTATSPGVGGGFGGPDFRSSAPRSGGFSDGIGVHSSLTAAAAAAAAATIGGAGANESSNCPLTPTDTYARHSLPPAAVLNTPPASSPSPLFVSAKKIGSEIRQRHGAKRRKGSNRRAKKARRSLRAAQKAAEAAAVEGASSDNCGAGSAEGINVAAAGLGGPRRLDSSPDRDGHAKVASGASASGSKPVSVDDSFSSADSSQDGVEGVQDAAEGVVSKSLEEMELNTPTSNAEETKAARGVGRGNTDDMGGIAHRDLTMDIPEVRRSSPSERQTRGFPLVLKAPPSPSGSSSLTRRAEDFDAAPWHHKRDDSDFDSDSDTDSDSDDSTTSSLGYPQMPKPPETATQEEKSRFYWEQLYGAPPPRPPSSRPLPHLLAGLGSSTTSLQQGQEHYVFQGSWSASRAPPSKSCLSSRKQASHAPSSRSTPMLSDRFGSLMHPSPDQIAAPNVMATPCRNDGMFTPKKDSPTEDYTPPEISNGKMAGGDEEKRPKYNVVFGNSKAAEFDTACPTDQIVSLPDDEAMMRFPVEYVEASVEEEFMHEETVHNSDVLDEWEQSFDSLMDDDEDGDTKARDSNEGVSSSAMDCDTDLSACFADDDMTPLSRPKRPKKKKRRKNKHRYRDSGDGEDRRKSSLFFSPGGGSLLGSDDEMETDQDPTPSCEKGRFSMVSAVDAEEVDDEMGRGSLYFSTPSSEGAQPGSIKNAAGDYASPTINAAKDLFGSSEQPASVERFEVGPDGIDESTTSALFTRLIDAQFIDRLDHRLASIGASDANLVTEYMLRRDNNRDMSDSNLDSICQVNPLILQSAPATIRNEVLNGVGPTPQPSSAKSAVDQSMSAADFCSKLAQAALYEWRAREVEIIKEVSASIQTASDSCDETLKTLDHLLSISQNDAPQRSPNASGLHQQVQQLEEVVMREEIAMDASIKRKSLTHAELEIEQSPPNPELSYQLLSAILPIQIDSLDEDMLQTSFLDDVSGLCTKISWKLSCGSSSDEASPQQGGGVTSSPKAIQSFEASSTTNPRVISSSSQLSPPIRSLQRYLLRNFITEESSTSSDDEYRAGLDRFISYLANRHADFPSAFSAIVDVLNKIRLLELDMCAVDERADCALEVSCPDESLIRLLIRIAFEDGSSLGVNLNLDQFDRISVPTFIPSDVTIVSIGNHAIEKEVRRKLTATIESTIRARQGCNAFLFKDIVSKCVEEVLASREI